VWINYGKRMIAYEWRGDFSNAALSALHAEGFGHQPVDHDWRARVTEHSLGWVCGWDGHDLVGFVNVAWDGGAMRSSSTPWSDPGYSGAEPGPG